MRSLRILCPVLLMFATTLGQDLQLQLRYQQETQPNSNRFHLLTRAETWRPAETAIIVCDVWDAHHCLNAVQRVEEFAPRLNEVLKQARNRGVTIIHSPSDCMAAYQGHAARQRAIDAPLAANPPNDIALWCSRIPAEERAVYPIDQSDGGEDDESSEHAAWVEHLKAEGRNPSRPWLKQSDLIQIDADRDFISDRGDEVWNVLEQRHIQNVILAGVHVNMCVLGRPFGLRQMARAGKHTVLLRDMTDAMYNPRCWPFVSHFTGNDLVISHIERFVCPTISSDQLIGGRPFRFAGDKRPRLAIVMAEGLYETDRTLPAFAATELGQQFRVSYVFGGDPQAHELPGLDVLDDADAVLFAVRRRPLPHDSMAAVQRFVQSGKPVLGIRTSSHAFSIRDAELPAGLTEWTEFDREVFGGNYHGHYPETQTSMVHVTADGQPLVNGLDAQFAQYGSLYQTKPLAEGTKVLLVGKSAGFEAEPVAWTFQRGDGGRSFYTSLGHPQDFEHPNFVRLLYNAICWATDQPQIDQPRTHPQAGHWTLAAVPTSSDRPTWFRCAVRIPTTWSQDLRLDGVGEAWVNGQRLAGGKIPPDSIQLNDLNLIAVRTSIGLREAPILRSAGRQLALRGRWQARPVDDHDWSNMPLPAKFGAPTDIVFEPANTP